MVALLHIWQTLPYELSEKSKRRRELQIAQMEAMYSGEKHFFVNRTLGAYLPKMVAMGKEEWLEWRDCVIKNVAMAEDTDDEDEDEDQAETEAEDGDEEDENQDEDEGFDGYDGFDDSDVDDIDEDADLFELDAFNLAMDDFRLKTVAMVQKG